MLYGETTRVTAVIPPEAVVCSFHAVELSGAEAHAASRGFLTLSGAVVQLGIPFDRLTLNPHGWKGTCSRVH